MALFIGPILTLNKCKNVSKKNAIKNCDPRCTSVAVLDKIEITWWLT